MTSRFADLSKASLTSSSEKSASSKSLSQRLYLTSDTWRTTQASLEICRDNSVTNRDWLRCIVHRYALTQREDAADHLMAYATALLYRMMPTPDMQFRAAGVSAHHLQQQRARRRLRKVVFLIFELPRCRHCGNRAAQSGRSLLIGCSPDDVGRIQASRSGHRFSMLSSIMDIIPPRAFRPGIPFILGELQPSWLSQA